MVYRFYGQFYQGKLPTFDLDTIDEFASIDSTGKPFLFGPYCGVDK